MADAGVKSHEFTCRHCGKVGNIFYDWQRCWECYESASTRDMRTVPSVCPECCRRHHQKPLSSK